MLNQSIKFTCYNKPDLEWDILAYTPNHRPLPASSVVSYCVVCGLFDNIL